MSKYEIVNKNGDKLIFDNQKQLADEIGISINGLKTRLQKMSKQEAYNMGVPKNNKISFKIILNSDSKKIFNSYRELADEIGISIGGLIGRLENMTPQEAYNMGVQKEWSTQITLKDGKKKKFNNKEGLAKEIGIAYSSLINRLITMSEQEAYNMGAKEDKNWNQEIILKDGTKKIFKTKLELAYEIGIQASSLLLRLENMKPQEAYNCDYKYEAFCLYNKELAYFSNIFKISKTSIFRNYNQFKNFMTLEEIIIYTKLNQRNPEVCIDNKKGIFQPIEEFCKDRNLDVKYTLEQINNGININNL